MVRRGSVWLMALLCVGILIGIEFPFAASETQQWTRGLSSDWQRGMFDRMAVQNGQLVLKQDVQIGWERQIPQLHGPARGSSLDTQGNLIVTGYTLRNNADHFHTLKYDPNGRVLWQRILPSGSSSRSMDAASDAQGNVYVAGYVRLGQYNYQVVKYDPNGNVLWQRILSSGNDDQAQAIAVDAQGNVVVTGNANGKNSDVFTAQYTSSGTLLWQRRFDGGSGDWGWGLALDGQGNAYVAGSSVVSGHKDMLLLKYDPTGRLLWQRTFDNGGEEVATAIALNPEGQLGLAGFSAGSNNTDMLIVVADEDGKVLWSRQENMSAQDRAFGVNWNAKGDLLVTGSVLKNGIEGLQTLKFDARGQRLWQHGEASALPSRGYTVETDKAGHVYVSGFLGTGYRTVQYRDGFVPRGTYQTEIHRYSAPMNFKTLSVETRLNGQTLIATVESSEDGFLTVTDSVRWVLRSQQSHYLLQDLKPGRYVRLRFEFLSNSPLLSPQLNTFTIVASRAP